MAKIIPEFKGTIACGLSSMPTSNLSGIKQDMSLDSSISRRKGNLQTDVQKRHEEADRKRLESIKRQRDIFSLKRNAISTSLKAIDQSAGNGIPLNKKVKFASSSSSGSDQDSEDEKPASAFDSGPIVISNGRKQLFEDDDGLDADFNVPQFSGNVGSKLAQLQSKFGGVDKRFRLDARFLDDNDDASSPGRPNPETEINEDSILKEERHSDIRILERVLGKPLEKATDAVADKKSKSTPYTRYDPENPSHRQFEVKEDIIDEPASKKDEVALSESSNSEVSDYEQPPSVHDLHHDTPSGLDPEFAENLRRKQADDKPVKNSQISSPGFSLRQLFGRDETTDEKSASNSTAAAFSLNIPLWQRPLMRIRDSSSEEEGDEPDTPVDVEKKRQLPKDKAVPKQGKSVFFFYNDQDKRIAEGQRFRRTEEIDVIRAKWEKQRVGLTQFYKSRRKEGLKKQKQRNEREARKHTVSNESSVEKHHEEMPFRTFNRKKRFG